MKPITFYFSENKNKLLRVKTVERVKASTKKC